MDQGNVQMDDTIVLRTDPEAVEDIISELGSMNAFYDRLEALVVRESAQRATLSLSSAISLDGEDVRGGSLVEIIGSLAGLATALSPIIIAWIRSRGFEVEERIETLAGGKSTRTIRMRRGAK